MQTPLALPVGVVYPDAMNPIFDDRGFRGESVSPHSRGCLGWIHGQVSRFRLGTPGPSQERKESRFAPALFFVLDGLDVLSIEDEGEILHCTVIDALVFLHCSPQHQKAVWEGILDVLTFCIASCSTSSTSQLVFDVLDALDVLHVLHVLTSCIASCSTASTRWCASTAFQSKTQICVFNDSKSWESFSIASTFPSATSGDEENPHDYYIPENIFSGRERSSHAGFRFPH